MKLTGRFVEAIDKPGRYSDDAVPGLMLFVQRRRTKGGAESITRSYVQRLTIGGVRVDIGLGPAKWKTLTEVRKTAAANYRAVLRGQDPRIGARGIPTFAEGIDAVLALQRPNWRDGGKSEAQWRASLAAYAGALMDRPVSDITAHDVLAVVGPVWNDKRETARRVLQRIGAVLRWAVAGGHRESTPIEAVRAALPKNGVHRKHHRALPHAEVRPALATIRESQAWAATKLALELVALTAARSGEVRLMTWEEVDMEAAVWTVPADRMKAGRVAPGPALRGRHGDSPRGCGALRRQRGLAGVSFSTRQGALGFDTREVTAGTRD